MIVLGGQILGESLRFACVLQQRCGQWRGRLRRSLNGNFDAGAFGQLRPPVEDYQPADDRTLHCHAFGSRNFMLPSYDTQSSEITKAPWPALRLRR